MGIRLFSKNSDDDICQCNACVAPPPPPLVDANPDPEQWEILEHVHCGDYLVVKIRYPNCTNFEGVKILVFKTSLPTLRKQRRIDPHFGEGSLIYPIARFQPTAEGWKDALLYAGAKACSCI